MKADPESDPPQRSGLALADLCISRPVFATMVNLLLVVLGWFSFQQIGVDQFPNVELPIITVTTTLRGASPEEIETAVTKPIEDIINTIQGVDELSSVSREGISMVTVQFVYERDRDIAAQDVKEGTARTARKMFPVVEHASDQPTADLLTQRIEVHEKTAWMLRSLLET